MAKPASKRFTRVWAEAAPTRRWQPHGWAAACIFSGASARTNWATGWRSILGGYGIAAHLARKETATGRSINLNWDNGCRHFISSVPNNRSLTGEDIDVEAMIAAGCRQLLRADVWFSESLLAEGNYALLGRARAAGIETYLDINWDPEWSVPGNGRRVRERRDQLTRILPYIDFAHGNERELAYFTGRNDLREACRFLLDHGCSNVVIHRGDKARRRSTPPKGGSKCRPRRSRASSAPRPAATSSARRTCCCTTWTQATG